jgi:hypothetical protein
MWPDGADEPDHGRFVGEDAQLAAGARRAIAREEVQRDQRHRRRYSLADSTNTVRHCRRYSK